MKNNKVHINDLLEPIDKLLVTQTLVQSTSEIVEKYAKTQTGERLKREEMAIDSLWKTLIILKKYESYSCIFFQLQTNNLPEWKKPSRLTSCSWSEKTV